MHINRRQHGCVRIFLPVCEGRISKNNYLYVTVFKCFLMTVVNESNHQLIIYQHTPINGIVLALSSAEYIILIMNLPGNARLISKLRPSVLLSLRSMTQLKNHIRAHAHT